MDSRAGCVFRERTVDEAELLLNNMLTNENNWTLLEPIPEEISEPVEPTPEPIPKPTPKKRGVLFLSPEDMCRGSRSTNTYGDRRTEPLSVRRGAEIARRADRGETHEKFTQLRSSPER